MSVNSRRNSGAAAAISASIASASTNDRLIPLDLELVATLTSRATGLWATNRR
jgi:hypothetical protein